VVGGGGDSDYTIQGKDISYTHERSMGGRGIPKTQLRRKRDGGEGYRLWKGLHLETETGPLLRLV